MGWTEEQARVTDVNAIEVAYRGRMAMLKAIFGGKDDPASVDVTKLPELKPGMLGRKG